MNIKEAANKLRATFHPLAMPHDTPPEDRHMVKFLEAVADALGVEKTPFVLHQLAEAMDAAGIHPDSNEYPKMMFSRTHPDRFGQQGTYDPRHDHVWVHVHDEDQEDALGEGWVSDHAQLPPRGEIPLYPAAKAKAAAAPVDEKESV